MFSIEDHIKEEKLSIDAMYKSINNLNYKEQIKNHLINRVRYLGSHFKFQPNTAQVESYADRLLKYQVKESELEKSIEHCINYLDSFPSFSNFFSVIKANSKHIRENESKNNQQLDKNILEAEFELENSLRIKFIDTFGKDGLTRYVNYYTDKVVVFDQDNKLGIKINYNRCALFDWHCSYYNPKKVKEVYDKKIIHALDKRVYFINTNDIPDILKKYNGSKRF